MEKVETLSLLQMINIQCSSSILGGMQSDYEELENLGYVKIDRHSSQYAATITPAGIEFLKQNDALKKHKGGAEHLERS